MSTWVEGLRGLEDRLHKGRRKMESHLLENHFNVAVDDQVIILHEDDASYIKSSERYEAIDAIDHLI